MAPTFEHGLFEYNLCDDINLALEIDPDVLGDWVVCDFVREKDFFDSSDQNWNSGFWWTATRFIDDYSSQNGFAGEVVEPAAPCFMDEGLCTVGGDSIEVIHH